jgi:hypothetical protein
MRRAAVLVMLLAACSERAATNEPTPDLAASEDLSAAAIDLAAPLDLRAPGSDGGADLAGAHDLAAASTDLARAGRFDGAIDPGCTQASCGTRVCGPSPCGFHCGSCAGQMDCNATACGNCGATCTDDNGDHICGGAEGLRRCADGTLRVCTCEGPPDVWLCTPPCP